MGHDTAKDETMSTQPADGGGGNTITDQQLFDHATTPDPTPSPSPSAPSQTPSSTGEATDATQAREDGRLRPDVPSTRPDLQQQPAQQGKPGEQPRTPEGKFAPKPQAQQPQQRMPEDHRVPLREMLDERERRQRIEAEYNQLVQHLQAQQKPQGPETIFDAPDEYLNQRVIAPLRQEMQMEMMRRTDLQSREFANVQFGEEAVNAALADIARIRQTPQGEFVFRTIMNSGHPYGALVKWHNQARAQQAIGNDPQTWLRQQQQAWFRDPKVRAAMAEDLRQEYAQQQQRNGSGRPPDVSLPPSLSSVPSSSGRGVELGDLSSESLFAHAIK
jgi:hypothetical protein